MKLLTIKSFSAFFVLLQLLQPLHSSEHKINKLERLDVNQSDMGWYMLFDFMHKTPIKPTYNEGTLTLNLFFEGVLPSEFKTNSNWDNFCQLHKEGLFKSIDLDERFGEAKGSILRIAFNENTTKDAEIEKNQFLIKWSLVETKGTRLVIDIINQKTLHKLKASATIFYASNDVMQNDFSQMPGLKKKSKNKKKRRVIIDAGHGGSDSGAVGFANLCEKDIALQVSKKLVPKLQAAGYNVHLTRSKDKEVSLSARCSLANQLKADAFVSIHLNSAGKVGGSTSGIETYFLDKKALFPAPKFGGYFFMNTNQDPSLIEALNKYNQNKVDSSKNLANCVQNRLIQNLHNNDFDTNDRGVKPTKVFRLLRMNNIPSTLVEIGFITNPQEAKQLSTEGYQETIADGILQGINRYFSQEM